MKRWLAGALCAFCSLLAQAATYQYASPLYDTLVAHTAAPCALGNCADFTTAMRIQGTFSVAALPPNQPAATNITGSVTSYSFSDGLTTYSSSDPRVRVYAFIAGTDATGRINSFTVILLRWQQPGPWAAGSRLDRTNFSLPGAAVSASFQNQTCLIAPAPSPNNGVPDTCNNTVNDTNSSRAQRLGVLGTLTLLPEPTPVPTLGAWPLLLTVLLVAGGARYCFAPSVRRRPCDRA